MARVSLYTVATTLVVSISCAAAGSFLQVRPHTEKSVSVDVVQQSFLSALSMNSERLRQFEDELRPMYEALPKNAQGALEPSVVRYALHRYFVQKHGWYMKGLEAPKKQANWNASTGILKDRVPEYVQGLLEEQVKEGWHLRELAICSSALNELIQKEVVQDLEFVYNMLDLATTDTLDDAKVHEVMDAYLAQYILEETWSDLSVAGMLTEVKETYTGWNDLSMWAEDVHKSMDFAQPNPFVQGTSFKRMTQIVKEIMHRYTSVQNVECSALTEALLDMEYAGTGRVPLADFYRIGLGDHFKFWETKDYLRHVGALDETDPKRTTLIIPNYVYGMNNCLASSSFFSVCCTNKCERLTAHLEKALVAPSATPQSIMKVVSALSSDTVDAPRTLSASLMKRLDEIAAHHGDGLVPLHGRLFSQWMHHAYPRECPFPHAEGADNEWTPEQWNTETGKHFSLSDGEMHRHIDHHAHQWSMRSREGEEELPWASFEELVGVHHHSHRSSKGFGSILRKGFAVIVVAVIAASMLRAWNFALGSLEPKISKTSKLESHLV